MCPSMLILKIMCKFAANKVFLSLSMKAMPVLNDNQHGDEGLASAMVKKKRNLKKGF